MFENFSWRHIPALLTAAPMFFGGLIDGFARPRGALLSWGVKKETANSRDAQIVYYGHSMRTSILGLLVFAFYFQGNYTAVDTTMAIMGSYGGLGDLYILWTYGNRSVVPVRFLSVLAIAAWGFAGMTASSAR